MKRPGDFAGASGSGDEIYHALTALDHFWQFETSQSLHVFFRARDEADVFWKRDLRWLAEVDAERMAFRRRVEAGNITENRIIKQLWLDDPAQNGRMIFQGPGERDVGLDLDSAKNEEAKPVRLVPDGQRSRRCERHEKAIRLILPKFLRSGR